MAAVSQMWVELIRVRIEINDGSTGVVDSFEIVLKTKLSPKLRTNLHVHEVNNEFHDGRWYRCLFG